jgi:hypothetical protein
LLFFGNWKLILHKTSALRSISAIENTTIINQNYQKVGAHGTRDVQASTDPAVYKFTYLPVGKSTAATIDVTLQMSILF